jgi:hypothetical protein
MGIMGSLFKPKKTGESLSDDVGSLPPPPPPLEGVQQPPKEQHDMEFPHIETTIKPETKPVPPWDMHVHKPVMTPIREAATPKTPERKAPREVSPVHKGFLRVDDYAAILETTSMIKTGIKHSEDIFSRLNEIREEQEQELDQWRERLEDVQKKLTYVDKTLFKVMN